MEDDKQSSPTGFSLHPAVDSRFITPTNSRTYSSPLGVGNTNCGLDCFVFLHCTMSGISVELTCQVPLFLRQQSRSSLGCRFRGHSALRTCVTSCPVAVMFVKPSTSKESATPTCSSNCIPFDAALTVESRRYALIHTGNHQQQRGLSLE